MTIKEKILKTVFGKMSEEDKNTVKALFAVEDTETEAALAEATLEDGTVIAYAGETLEVGAEVFVVTEGGEQTPAPDGEHKTQDGLVIVVADGKVTDIREPEAMGEDIEKRVKDLEKKLATLSATEKSLRDSLENKEREIKVLASVVSGILDNPVSDEGRPADSAEEGYSIAELRNTFREDLKSLRRDSDASEYAEKRRKQFARAAKGDEKRIKELEEKFRLTQN